MLDLLISYLNFFIIGIKYIVKLIAFQPPNPKGYRVNNEIKIEDNEIQGIKENNINNNIEILFIIPNKKNNDNKKKHEKKKQKRQVEYKPAPNYYSDFELVYVENSDNNTKIPVFIFKQRSFMTEIYGHSYINDCIIIYCHGNSGDIGTSFMECQLLSRNLNCNVLCFEYPGYGLSNDFNNTNEKRAYHNIRQAYNYARTKLKYEPENIIIYGFSLGTGIAFDLACDKKYPIGGVILQSPFLSIIRTIYNFKKTYYFDIFNNCDKAKFCSSKIFFIHGDRDTIVPYIHGRILAKLIPKKFFCGFYTVHGANHNDILRHAKETIYNKITNFIESIYSPVKPIPEDYSSDFDFSSIKNDNIKKMNTSQAITKPNEYEKKLKFDLNTINNNITSNDELNVLEKEKEKNTLDYYNNINNNDNNNDFLTNKNNVYQPNNKNESTKEEIKKENDKSSIFSKENDEESDDPKFLNSKDIKLNIDNYNINLKVNDLNTISSNIKNNNYKNDFTINNEEGTKSEIK